MKKCYKCKLLLPSDKFSKNGYNPDGLQGRCKLCQKKVREIVAPNERRRVSSWCKRNPEKSKNRQLKRLYGISLDDYNEILLSQGSKCAICKSIETGGKSRYFAVDHDHKTTKVRSLLCDRCNQALGHAKENVEVLQSMIEYIKKHSDCSYIGTLRGATNAKSSVQF